MGCFDETKVINFEDFDTNTFGKQSDELSIICVATHYEGEPCDNTVKFHKWIKELKKNNERSALQNLSFTIFGLGDTVYEQFNAMGRYFDKTLEELGGQRLYAAGEGNSDN